MDQQQELIEPQKPEEISGLTEVVPNHQQRVRYRQHRQSLEIKLKQPLLPALSQRPTHIPKYSIRPQYPFQLKHSKGHRLAIT